MKRVLKAIEDLKQGKMIILIDDENRENEGDIVACAQNIQPETVNFMSKEARGLICLSMTESHIKKLELPLMVPEDLNQTPNKTAFTISIEAAKGVTTGISAKDRAHTIRVASNPTCCRGDLRVPGHVFPLMAKANGVLTRPGHTEGSVDLVKLAGQGESAVICEIINDDGTMARLYDLELFSKKHNLSIVSIEELITYRKEMSL